MIPRNLKLIFRYLHKLVLIEVLSISLLFMVIQKMDLILSVLVGVIFSYISFINLIKSQIKILIQKNKNKSFMGLLNRLAYLAIPIMLAIEFQILNIAVILCSLWAYQLNYIGINVIRSVRKMYARKNKNT